MLSTAWSRYFPYERILVGTRREYASLLQKQIPELPPDNYILDRLGRRDSPGIGAGLRFISTSGIRKQLWLC